MFLRYVLVGFFLATASLANASERFVIKFELMQGEQKVDWGRLLVSDKSRTWSNGLKRSYLKLRCVEKVAGKIQKQFSTEDHFAGLRVTHKQVGDSIELKVVYSTVQARLMEIRELPNNECRDMPPIVTTVSETYTFPAKDGVKDARPFGQNMTFRVNLQSLGGNW